MWWGLVGGPIVRRPGHRSFLPGRRMAAANLSLPASRYSSFTALGLGERRWSLRHRRILHRRGLPRQRGGCGDRSRRVAPLPEATRVVLLERALADLCRPSRIHSCPATRDRSGLDLDRRPARPRRALERDRCVPSGSRARRPRSSAWRLAHLGGEPGAASPRSCPRASPRTELRLTTDPTSAERAGIRVVAPHRLRPARAGLPASVGLGWKSPGSSCLRLRSGRRRAASDASTRAHVEFSDRRRARASR